MAEISCAVRRGTRDEGLSSVVIRNFLRGLRPSTPRVIVQPYLDDQFDDGFSTHRRQSHAAQSAFEFSLGAAPLSNKQPRIALRSPADGNVHLACLHASCQARDRRLEASLCAKFVACSAGAHHPALPTRLSLPNTAKRKILTIPRVRYV